MTHLKSLHSHCLNVLVPNYWSLVCRQPRLLLPFLGLSTFIFLFFSFLLFFTSQPRLQRINLQSCGIYGHIHTYAYGVHTYIHTYMYIHLVNHVERGWFWILCYLISLILHRIYSVLVTAETKAKCTRCPIKPKPTHRKTTVSAIDHPPDQCRKTVLSTCYSVAPAVALSQPTFQDSINVLSYPFDNDVGARRKDRDLFQLPRYIVVALLIL